MKYYKFNRDSSYAAKFCRLTHSRKKLSYMIGTGRSRLLDSCYFESQTWGAFRKAWRGYIIAKNKDEIDRLYYYAEVIQKLQGELGLPVSSFPSLGLSPVEQAHDASEDYDPADDFHSAMRKEQNYNPSDDFHSAMRKEQNYNPSDDFHSAMRKEQNYNPSDDFHSAMRKEQNYNPSDDFHSAMRKEQNYNPSDDFHSAMRKEQNYNPSEE